MCAKSKSGGTRTYIRGRVGSEVYSVGRDAKGKKQQVVRSLAESVANPQTQAQMRGRMIMSTIAQALAVLRPIVDHSFDNVTGSRANLAEFTSRNYGAIKADIAANPSGSNAFGLVKYQEKGAKRGAYVISDGAAQLPATLSLVKASGILTITLPADNITIGGLKSALGLTEEEYFTLVGMAISGNAYYERFRINPSLAAATVISADNIADIFAVEGNAAAVVAIASNVVSITLDAVAGCCAVIISKKVSGKYIHNKATLGDSLNFGFTSDEALPTYPVGAQNYLNGGDIFGMSESFVQGTSTTPDVSTTPSSITAVTVNGAALANGAKAQAQVGDNTIVATIAAGTDGGSYALGVVTGSQPAIGASVAAGNQTAITGSSVTKTLAYAENDADSYICLVRNNQVIQVWGSIGAGAGSDENGHPIDTGD